MIFAQFNSQFNCFILNLCVNPSKAKFGFCFLIISPSHSFCYLSMCLVPLHFSCHVFSIYSNILIYFNVFVHFYSFFSIARTTIVKMDVANKSLLLLLLLLVLLLLLLKSRTSRNSFSQATHSVSSENNQEQNQGRE